MSPVEDRRYGKHHQRDLLDDARRDSERRVRWEYYKPLIMLVLGVALSVIIFATNAHRAGLVASVLSAVIFVGLFLVLSVPAGVVGLLVACKIFATDAGPLPLAMLRLAGVYAVTLIAMLFLGNFLCAAVFVCGMIMAGLIAILFDMDVKEGAVVTIVSWIAFVAINILLAAALR